MGSEVELSEVSRLTDALEPISRDHLGGDESVKQHRHHDTDARHSEPEGLWRWRITGQWELSAGATIGQVIVLTLVFAVLLWLWIPPNEDAVTVAMQAGIAILWIWVAYLLFGPYRTAYRRPGTGTSIHGGPGGESPEVTDEA